MALSLRAPLGRGSVRIESDDLRGDDGEGETAGNLGTDERCGGKTLETETVDVPGAAGREDGTRLGSSVVSSGLRQKAYRGRRWNEKSFGIGKQGQKTTI